MPNEKHMDSKRITIDGIPALVWGKPAERVYIHVHGKMSRKEYAADFAALAEKHGWQTVSFDLPRHGERQNEPRPCDVWNGVADLQAVGAYALAHWREAALFACSIGAFFALHAYADIPLTKGLFQSPIVDMDGLVRQMMAWANVTPAQLEAAGEIETPVDTLSWRYWQYVQAHPVTRWPFPTSILYAGKDALQTREMIEAFAQRFGAQVTVSEGSEHPFMGAGDAAVVRAWLEKVLG